MSEMLQCDIAIIGGGAGGLSVAAVAAQLGLSVVLVEGNKMGGDCLFMPRYYFLIQYA